MPTYTLTREGKSITVTSPRELTAAELSHVSSRSFGGAARGPSGAFDWSRPDTYADPAAQAQLKENERFVSERLVPGILGAATIATGGAAAPLAGVPAAVGRIAGAGLAGGAEAAARGESIGWATFLDLAVAGLTEGALAGAVKLKPPKMFGGMPSLSDLAEKMRSTNAGLRHATEAPMQALDMLRARLPKGRWLNVPTLAKARGTKELLTVDEAVRRLAELTGPEYRVARAEIASELSRLDVQRVTGPKPLAGAIFKTFTEPERFLYRGTPLERVAERVVGATRHPITRTAADVAATADVEGLPAGAWPAMLGAQQASSVAERVMGR